jgi:cytochrome c551/c552
MKPITKTTILLAAIVGLSITLAQAEDAKAIYEKSCQKCHGADGKGQTTMGKKLGLKDYTDAKVQAEMKDEDMAKAIKEGVQKDGKTVMKPLEGASDADVKALVALVRGFKS